MTREPDHGDLVIARGPWFRPGNVLGRECRLFDRGGFLMLACELGCGRVAVVLGVCFVFMPGRARAQSATTPAAPPAAADATGAAPAEEPRGHINLTGSSPTIDLSTPKPPGPVGRTYRQHEGFYVRVGGGIGSLLSANIDQGP